MKRLIKKTWFISPYSAGLLLTCRFPATQLQPSFSTYSSSYHSALTRNMDRKSQLISSCGLQVQVSPRPKQIYRVLSFPIRTESRNRHNTSLTSRLSLRVLFSSFVFSLPFISLLLLLYRFPRTVLAMIPNPLFCQVEPSSKRGDLDELPARYVEPFLFQALILRIPPE